MNRNVRRVWGLSHALLGTLGLFLFHALLVKQFRDAPLTLSTLLALAFVTILINREIASGVATTERTTLQRAWASLDGPELLLIAFFFVLLVVFDSGYLRATADGRHYFVQVRSLIMDQDLDFANENQRFRTEMPEIFPFGAAVMWMPFFVAAHAWLSLLNLAGASYDVSGFSNPYQMAVGIGTLVYGFAGLVIVYRIVGNYFSAWMAAITTVFVAAGSFLIWYLAIESSYTHGNSLFATMLFLLVWFRARTDRTTTQWICLGLAAGLMTMVRWQNVVYLLFPLTDGLGLMRRALSGVDAPSNIRLNDMGRSGAAFGLAFLAGVSPQLAFWRVVNGGWLALPHGQSGQQWWADSLVIDVLFSSNHGLFSWHPVLFFAALGIPLVLIRDVRFVGLLTLVFVAQIYINGAVATWWGGHAFGGRRFANCTLLFALGLAALLNWVRRRPMVAAVSVLSTLVLANAFFMFDIKGGRLPTSEGIGLNRIMSGAYSRLGNPFSLPVSLVYTRWYGISPWQYDQLGRQTYNNLRIDVGTAADERFLGRGWSTAETAGDASYRWAVGHESIVIAPLKATTFVLPGEPLEQADYVVRLHVEPYRFDGAPPQSIELWANDVLAGRVRLGNGPNTYSVEVMRELLRRNLNVFRFRYAYARAPSDGGGQDTRPLAVRFDYIEFIRQPS